ncbi:MAG: phosphate-starvation-inducible PsiE family protein [Acidimicrobiales bacterium]
MRETPETPAERSTVRGARTAERGAERQDIVARLTTLSLHMIEDVIYTLTALLLVAGAFIVLGSAVYHLVTEVSDGVTKAIEAALNSLLIVFILVELLTAVRSAIDEHLLVAEPFLLVGILAAIKEMVVLATFGIDKEKASDSVLKLGVLGALVIGLSVATLILRRREREPKEVGD